MQTKIIIIIKDVVPVSCVITDELLKLERRRKRKFGAEP
jgi:hypothetical protein